MQWERHRSDSSTAPCPNAPTTRQRSRFPRLPQSVNGTGSFRRDLTNVAGCVVKGAPFNSRVTVTNRDNSRSVQCINNVGGIQADADVVLHADAFLQIADLTDAPIAVQITW